MTARTSIEINPNLRIDGIYTIVDLDEDIQGDTPRLLDAVEVFESSSGLFGQGWVTSIDEVERTVTLLIDWANLVLPTTRTVGAPLAASDANLTLMLGTTPVHMQGPTKTHGEKAVVPLELAS
jgi:hypothetical protein